MISHQCNKNKVNYDHSFGCRVMAQMLFWANICPFTSLGVYGVLPGSGVMAWDGRNEGWTDRKSDIKRWVLIIISNG